MKNKDLTTQEVRFLLKSQGIKVRPSYCHDDYMWTSFTMPYPLKNKLNRICKRTGVTRSRIVQMFLERVDEKNLLKSLENMSK